jgi:hypothetical protein
MKTYNNDPVFLITQQGLQEAIEVVLKKQIEQLEQRLKMSSKILTREEAAFDSKVSANTISKWVKQGYLENRGIGRKIMIAQSDLIDVKSRVFNHKKNNFQTWE